MEGGLLGKIKISNMKIQKNFLTICVMLVIHSLECWMKMTLNTIKLKILLSFI